MTSLLNVPNDEQIQFTYWTRNKRNGVHTKHAHTQNVLSATNQTRLALDEGSKCESNLSRV